MPSKPVWLVQNCELQWLSEKPVLFLEKVGDFLDSQRFNALFWNSYQKAKETSHRLKHSIQKILMIVLSLSGTLSTTRNPSWNNTTDCSLGHHLIPENRKTEGTIILGFYHWIWIKKFFSSKSYMARPAHLALSEKKKKKKDTKQNKKTTTTWSQ